MARHMKFAKRANRANPREERNHNGNDPFEFGIPKTSRGHRNKYRTNQFHDDERPIKGKKVEIIPRNVSQETYLDALIDQRKTIVFAIGPAGTGKTLLATQYAVSELQKGNIKKIVITRPLVSVDEQIGFLPGTVLQKLAPWAVPVMDIFKETFPVPVVENMLANEVIEIAALGFLRGRTFKDTILIFDESQNATPAQMQLIATRLGEGSRMFVTGDLQQTDRGFEDKNGLKDFVERIRRKGSNQIAVCQFDMGDIERHPIVEEVLRLYKDDVPQDDTDEAPFLPNFLTDK